MVDRAKAEKTKVQSCAIPYRRRKGELQLCLITTSEGRWGFPKGNIDPGETIMQAALKEAYEEAGLHGSLDDRPLGSYKMDKTECRQSVVVLLMKVDSCDDDWQESDQRERRWMTPGRARKLIEQEEIRNMIDATIKRLSK